VTEPASASGCPETSGKHRVTVDEQLAAAAATIAAMPDAAITERLAALEAAHRDRSALASARLRARLDCLELDWAAYELARQQDEAGQLEAAARWYRLAAANDFADAPVRLGQVLETLAHAAADQRAELALVSEAARWYAEAYGAGHPEAAERLDGMIGRHDARRGQPAGAPAASPGLPPGPDGCELGGLAAVLDGSDLVTATVHFRHCTACQREFVSRGGLLPDLSGHVRPADLSGLAGPDGARARAPGPPPPPPAGWR
jgi:TPR repeat protein